MNRDLKNRPVSPATLANRATVMRILGETPDDTTLIQNPWVIDNSQKASDMLKACLYGALPEKAVNRAADLPPEKAVFFLKILYLRIRNDVLPDTEGKANSVILRQRNANYTLFANAGCHFYTQTFAELNARMPGSGEKSHDELLAFLKANPPVQDTPAAANAALALKKIEERGRSWIPQDEPVQPSSVTLAPVPLHPGGSIARPAAATAWSPAKPAKDLIPTHKASEPIAQNPQTRASVPISETMHVTDRVERKATYSPPMTKTFQKSLLQQQKPSDIHPTQGVEPPALAQDVKTEPCSLLPVIDDINRPVNHQPIPVVVDVVADTTRQNIPKATSVFIYKRRGNLARRYVRMASNHLDESQNSLLALHQKALDTTTRLRADAATSFRSDTAAIGWWSQKLWIDMKAAGVVTYASARQSLEELSGQADALFFIADVKARSALLYTEAKLDVVGSRMANAFRPLKNTGVIVGVVLSQAAFRVGNQIAYKASHEFERFKPWAQKELNVAKEHIVDISSRTAQRVKSFLNQSPKP